MTASAAIVLVAHGAATDAARALLERIEAAAQAAFPHHAIHWAFTSERVRWQLAATSIDEVLEQLRGRGMRSAVLQSLHVVAAGEFAKVAAAGVEGLRMTVGRPLLDSEQDIEEVAAALAAEVRPDALNVIVGHGSRDPDADRSLRMLAERLDMRYCSLMDPEAPEPLRRMGAVESVHFVPLLLLPGHHVMDDLMGARRDSWRNLVAAEQVSCAGCLGDNEGVLAVYWRHVRAALDELGG